MSCCCWRVKQRPWASGPPLLGPLCLAQDPCSQLWLGALCQVFLRWSWGGDVPTSSAVSPVLPVTPLQGCGALRLETSPAHMCVWRERRQPPPLHGGTGISWLLALGFASRLCPYCPKSWQHPAKHEPAAPSTPSPTLVVLELRLPGATRLPGFTPTGEAAPRPGKPRGEPLRICSLRPLGGVLQARCFVPPEQDALEEVRGSTEAQGWES